jgi:hypothetical protein
MKLTTVLLLFVGLGCGGAPPSDPITISSTPTTPDLGPAVAPDLGPPAQPDLAGAACAAVVCTAADACHAAGSCDPATGQCSSPALADGSACAVAAGSGQCAAGSCVVTCTSAAGAVDQAQLSDPGWYVGLTPSQMPVGQTLVAGAAGQLTGVELGIHRCGSDDPSALVQLDVADTLGNVIATASLPVSQLDDNCSGSNFDVGTIVGTFFDLTSSCAEVAAGQPLSLSLSIVGLTADSCDPSSGTCAISGRECDFDQDCQIRMNVDMASDLYASGSATVRGSAMGDDLTFKTFVR